MLKHVGGATYQRFAVKNIIWANPVTNQVAVKMNTPEGREIITVTEEELTKAVSKLDNYFAGGGYLINLDMINRIFRAMRGATLMYNVVFEGVNVNDDIFITAENFEELKEKFIFI